MPTRAQTDNHATTEARKPWQTPALILAESRDSQKDAFTLESTFAGPS